MKLYFYSLVLCLFSFTQIYTMMEPEIELQQHLLSSSSDYYVFISNKGSANYAFKKELVAPFIQAFCQEFNISWTEDKSVFQIDVSPKELKNISKLISDLISTNYLTSPQISYKKMINENMGYLRSLSPVDLGDKNI